MHAEKFQNTEIARKLSITAQYVTTSSLQELYETCMYNNFTYRIEPDRYNLIPRKYSKEQRAFNTRI